MYRYGDFPELFWDLDPAAVVDRTHPSILVRLITDGSEDALRKLLAVDALRSGIDTLPVADHTRYFWRKVLAQIPASASPAPPEDGAGAERR